MSYIIITVCVAARLLDCCVRGGSGRVFCGSYVLAWLGGLCVGVGQRGGILWLWYMIMIVWEAVALVRTASVGH